MRPPDGVPDEGIALRASGVRVAYERDIEILRGVDLLARTRRVTLVIGPNGAGKSTLLNGIAGLAPVTGGTIRHGGADITGWTPRARLAHGISIVPQSGTLFGAMSVRENLQMGGWLRRRERAWIAARIEAVTGGFAFARELLDRPAGDLSGGQQKLVEIMRSLVLEPTVLLLDEPTAGLSPKLADTVYDHVAALPREHGVTVLLVDQNVRSSLKVSDDVYVLAMGLNNTQGTAAEIGGRLGEITASWVQQGVSGVVRA